jgi:spore germination protein YaaH
MKYRQSISCVMLCLLVFLASCASEAGPTTPKLASTPSLSPSTPIAHATPPVQENLPNGLLNPAYPVMDWVFNITCGQAVTSYNRSSMRSTIAYDSAAWLFPDDGHLVEGTQNCAKDALLAQARNQHLPTLLTVGIDASWPVQTVAAYIDQAASQPVVPCTIPAPTLICSIVNWAMSGGYMGVIIDFELVQQDYPGIATKFGTFMQKLQAALHARGLLCGVTLIPKLSDNPDNDPFSHIDRFEDWKLLSHTDFLVDMVLDFDNALKTPGPITSIGWMEKQLDYLWQTIPQALSKTIFEFPLYGREWQQAANGSWQSLQDESCQQVDAQKASQSLLINTSPDSDTPEIAWNDQQGRRHEVWYNTPSSLMAVITYAQEKAQALLNNPHYKLPTSFWYRGAECPGFFGQGNALETFYNQ